MKRTHAIRMSVAVILLGGVWPASSRVRAQSEPAATASTPQASPSLLQSLLDKAHVFEARGRMDLAEQTWQQVLIADPANAEALGGMARGAKAEGNTALSNTYVGRLSGLHPNDPNPMRVENVSVGAEQTQMARLQQAGKLAQAGQYAAAMGIYREVLGATPPAGDWSLAYYETQSATDDGRPHAIAGLTALVGRFPSDARYQIALGRILTYNPSTRTEGRNYLERFSSDPQAVEALRQSLLWDSANPAMAPQIRAFLATHHDPQLAQAMQASALPKAVHPDAVAVATPAMARPPGVASSAVKARSAVKSAAETAAYNALNARHTEEAESRFKAILVRNPENARALAGVGYVRMQQGNFSGAISFLEQAKRGDSADNAIDAALDTSRFWFVMGEGQAALGANDLTTAEKQYRAALAVRPSSPEATAGLGGTLLRAQQPAAAIPLFQTYVQSTPATPDGWRGLFMAQYLAGNAAQALATQKRIPAAPLASLMRDPLFLQTLASAYLSVGRNTDAERALETALDLPFPADAKGLKADTQIQFAAILLTANHLDQAAGLYRQVLAADHGNASAWQGLIHTEHALGHDAEALQTIESMPPAMYTATMRDPGFETTVASVYQAQKKLDVAEDLLDKAIAQQRSAGQKPLLAMQMQLAAIYVERGSGPAALVIYRQAIADDPNRAEAWAGLLSALHATGQNREAVSQEQRMPAPVRGQLERSIGYLQTMAAVNSALGQSRQAALYLGRVEQFYAAQHAAPPAEVDIQNAWLQYNGVDDPALYHQLMELGGRGDLTDVERRTVQTIWTSWAARRANQATGAENPQQAIAILNAAAQSFPGNPQVMKALAEGYSRAGRPSEAVQIFKAQDMAAVSVVDYQDAVGAAIAAGDNKDAAAWMRHALAAYPADPQVMILAARFEQARGDTTRAIGYYRKSLKAMPLSHTGEPGAFALSDTARLPGEGATEALSAVLAPNAAPLDPKSLPGQLYLPSYDDVRPASVLPTDGSSIVPPYMSNRVPQPSAPKPEGKGRLRDYEPQSRSGRAPGAGPDVRATAEVASTLHYAVAIELSKSTPLPTASAQVSGVQVAPSANEVSTPLDDQRQQVARATRQAAVSPDHELFKSFVPYVAPPSAVASNALPAAVLVHLVDNTPHPAMRETELTDVIPTGKYIPNTRAASSISSHPDIAAAQAAGIRQHQSDTETSAAGQSTTLTDDAVLPVTRNAQYVVAQNQGGPQVPRPATMPRSSSNAPDDAKQQYAQPAQTHSSGLTPPRRHTPRLTSEPSFATPAELPMTAPPAAPVDVAPLEAEATVPAIPQTYPPVNLRYTNPGPPSDATLMARNQPPVRGNLAASPELSTRQQTERQLAALEASYSGWLGGTGIGRYRSGTAGLDRLSDSESPAEASFEFGHTMRLTAIALPVFLQSGRLNPSTFVFSSPAAVPYLGTLPANASTAPAQQVANGIGGELQLTTKNLGLAAGYTPYQFLVRNITGRLRWRPAGGHVTLFADRSPVKDTQLSYAGMRDPGSISPTYSGTIWGGVIATTGGARLDLGSGGSAFYLSGSAGVLHGDHVLGNIKFDGGTGATFRVKNWPDAGILTVGGSLFGMHYQHNEVGLTYGQGGYFSPKYYALAAAPVTFSGHYRSNMHYVLSSALGVQTLQQDQADFFPLDPGLENALTTALNCTAPQLAAHICGEYPGGGNTGFSYSVDSAISYRYREHWYMGGFLSANNTSNYNNILGGFFFRYVFRPQRSSDEAPSGLFTANGFRPLQIP